MLTARELSTLINLWLRQYITIYIRTAALLFRPIALLSSRSVSCK